jgi:hypothetical protein
VEQPPQNFTSNAFTMPDLRLTAGDTAAGARRSRNLIHDRQGWADALFPGLGFSGTSGGSYASQSSRRQSFPPETRFSWSSIKQSGRKRRQRRLGVDGPPSLPWGR